MGKKKTWVRLKKVIQRLLRIEFPPQKGDGGAYSDKLIQISKPQTDSTSVMKDSVVVAGPIRK